MPGGNTRFELREKVQVHSTERLESTRKNLTTKFFVDDALVLRRPKRNQEIRANLLQGTRVAKGRRESECGHVKKMSERKKRQKRLLCAGWIVLFPTQHMLGGWTYIASVLRNSCAICSRFVTCFARSSAISMQRQA